MKRERILLVTLLVMVTLSVVITSLATATAMAAAASLTDDTNLKPHPQKEEETKAMSGGGEAIILVKTVGLDPGSCASTQTILVTPGTEVTYCYVVTNTGTVTLTAHDLEDSELGTILDARSAQLVPASTFFLTQTAVITTPTVNTATWRAYNPGPTNIISYTDAATVIANDLNTCRTPNLAIPDNEVTGTMDSMNVATAGTIVDLNVYLEADHTWVGDLKFTLEHVTSGITTTLIDRPGVPATPPFGCQSNDIQAILDDEASATVETSCGPSNLALAGHFVGGDPISNTLLTAFDGQELMGQWRLHVSDNSLGDTGLLNSWCLLPTLAEPDISLNPTELAATQLPDVQTVQILTLRNSGDAPLDWLIHESVEGVTAVSHRPVPFITQSTNNSLQLKSATDSVSDETILEEVTKQTAVHGPVAAPPSSILHNNGPLVNMPGAGAGGADASVVQNSSQGMSTFGFAHQVALGNSVADDFTISDPSGWYIDEITFFAYQTGSPLTPTITAVNYRIWDGSPHDPASNIVFGHTLLNRLKDTAWSGIYRASETTLDAIDRPVMQNTANGGIVLSPGTYWLEWQADGSLPTGPWAPPVTISGVVTTGNALQFFNSAWIPIVDSNTNAQHGLPFIISGHVVEEIPWASVPSVSGTLPSGTTEVTVTFDSTGLSFGTYTGTLFIVSNDPDTPLIPVPLTLTVDLAHVYLPYITKP